MQSLHIYLQYVSTQMHSSLNPEEIHGLNWIDNYLKVHFKKMQCENEAYIHESWCYNIMPCCYWQLCNDIKLQAERVPPQEH